jgi:uncharacterized protein
VEFAEVIRTAAELRRVIGPPVERSLKKEITRLDAHCRALIARSPFVLIASGNAAGRMDVSPKGDHAGFVLVLDDETLAIPDRPGNRRADTFTNVLESPGVGLLFLVPGKLETLRVNGKARIVRDLGLRERMSFSGKVPELALVVTVQQAFIHCGKCMLRSHLWHQEQWPDIEGLPTQAQCLVDHGKLEESLQEVQASIEHSRKTGLY